MVWLLLKLVQPLLKYSWGIFRVPIYYYYFFIRRDLLIWGRDYNESRILLSSSFISPAWSKIIGSNPIPCSRHLVWAAWLSRFVVIWSSIAKCPLAIQDREITAKSITIRGRKCHDDWRHSTEGIVRRSVGLLSDSSGRSPIDSMFNPNPPPDKKRQTSSRMKLCNPIFPIMI